MATTEEMAHVSTPSKCEDAPSKSTQATSKKNREIRQFLRLATRMADQNSGVLTVEALEDLKELLPDDVCHSPEALREVLARLASLKIEIAEGETRSVIQDRPATDIVGCLVDSPEALQHREDEADPDFDDASRANANLYDLDSGADDVPFENNEEALDVSLERKLGRDVAHCLDALLDALADSDASVAAVSEVLQAHLHASPDEKSFFPKDLADSVSQASLAKVVKQIRTLTEALKSSDTDERQIAEIRGAIRTAISNLSPSEKFVSQVANHLRQAGDAHQDAALKIERALRQAKAARDVLVQREQPFIYRTAQAFDHWGVSRDDLIQEGNLGLMNALGALKHRRGNLVGYLHEAIRQRMEQLIASQSAPVQLSLEEGQALLAMEEAERASLTQTGKVPSEEKLQALAKSFGVKDFHAESGASVLRAAATPASLSQEFEDECASDGEDLDAEASMDLAKSEQSFRELIETSVGSPLDVDWTKDPQIALNRREMLEKLHEALDTLQDNEREVLWMRFGLDGDKCRTLQQIGEDKGVTRERIRQIEAKAMEALRHKSRRRVLEAFVETDGTASQDDTLSSESEQNTESQPKTSANPIVIDSAADEKATDL